jgi:hypothetical protein
MYARGGLIMLACATATMLAVNAAAVAKPHDGPLASSACLKSLAPLAQDEVPSSNRFAPAACPAQAIPAAFYYDRASGAARAARAIATGEVVSRFPEYARDVVEPGQHVTLAVTIGAVRVERTVEALQEARPGEWLFVRDDEGHIFSVRYGVAKP